MVRRFPTVDVESTRDPMYELVDEAYCVEIPVDEAYARVVCPLNVFVPLQILFVVVPNASENVRSAERSPPPRIGYVVVIVLVFGTAVNPRAAW